MLLGPIATRSRHRDQHADSDREISNMRLLETDTTAEVHTNMKSGEHSLSFAGLYGGGRDSGVAVMLPFRSSTNMSSGRMRSFCTPDGAMAMLLCAVRTLMPPPVPDTQPCAHNAAA